MLATINAANTNCMDSPWSVGSARSVQGIEDRLTFGMSVLRQPPDTPAVLSIVIVHITNFVLCDVTEDRAVVGRRSFIHDFDNDTNGLLYFLGTYGDKTRQYQNPTQTKAVIVSCSALHADSALSAFVGRDIAQCRTTKPHGDDSNGEDEVLEDEESLDWCTEVPSSESEYDDGHLNEAEAHSDVMNTCAFVCVNLKHIQLQIKRYSLRQNGCDETMSHWNLEASHDGRDWITLKRHDNDPSLSESAAGQTHSWNVAADAYYAFFRLTSDKHGISFCGLELYGDVINCYVVLPMFIDEHIHEEKLGDDDASFSWKRVINALRYQMYGGIADCVDRYIKNNALEEKVDQETVDMVLTDISKTERLSNEKEAFMKKLIRNATRYDCETQGTVSTCGASPAPRNKFHIFRPEA